MSVAVREAWWIDFGTHGRVTLQSDEAGRAADEGAAVTHLRAVPAGIAHGVAPSVAGILDMIEAWGRAEAVERDQHGRLAEIERAIRAYGDAGCPVYLVNTGETRNGRELFERHDVRPPLCEAETLYTGRGAA